MGRWRLYKKLYFAFKYPKGLFSQIVTINANNATLRENEQESVCFVFVLCDCCEVSWNQNRSGWKRPQSSLSPTALPWCRAVAGGGSEGKCSHSRVALCIQSLSAWITSVPCSAATFKVPSVLSQPGCLRSRLSLRKPRAAAADGQEQLVNFLQLPGRAVHVGRKHQYKSLVNSLVI